MITHVPEEWRAPGRDRHRIDQNDPAESTTVEQVRSEHGGAAEIMTDDDRAIQPPEIEQGIEDLVLHSQRDVARRLARLPVAEQVVEMDAELTGQSADQVAQVER